MESKIEIEWIGFFYSWFIPWDYIGRIIFPE